MLWIQRIVAYLYFSLQSCPVRLEAACVSIPPATSWAYGCQIGSSSVDWVHVIKVWSITLCLRWTTFGRSPTPFSSSAGSMATTLQVKGYIFVQARGSGFEHLVGHCVSEARYPVQPPGAAPTSTAKSSLLVQKWEWMRFWWWSKVYLDFGKMKPSSAGVNNWHASASFSSALVGWLFQFCRVDFSNLLKLSSNSGEGSPSPGLAIVSRYWNDIKFTKKSTSEDAGIKHKMPNSIKPSTWSNVKMPQPILSDSRLTATNKVQNWQEMSIWGRLGVGRLWHAMWVELGELLSVAVVLSMYNVSMYNAAECRWPVEGAS